MQPQEDEAISKPSPSSIVCLLTTRKLLGSKIASQPETVAMGNFSVRTGIRISEAHRLQEVHPMSTEGASGSFFARVFTNDALRKGFAAAIAGAIISVVSEAVWPSNR